MGDGRKVRESKGSGRKVKKMAGKSGRVRENKVREMAGK